MDHDDPGAERAEAILAALVEGDLDHLEDLLPSRAETEERRRRLLAEIHTEDPLYAAVLEHGALRTTDPYELLDAALGRVLAVAPRPRWHADAACAGRQDVNFFPGRGEDVRPAQELCQTCPVQEDCLEEALRTKESHGIWGGASERQRRQLRRERRGAA